MIKDLEMIVSAYASLQEKVEEARKVFGKPLMLTEKILISHLAEPLQKAPEQLKSYVNFNPDRVAMQDATAQMAILQFMVTGKKKVAVPTTVHADHLIQAKIDSNTDLISLFRRAAIQPAITQNLCDCIQPFGNPVVPDVYWMLRRS